jgi:glycosyltransferase involved in cell wall biosynthesis
MRVLFFNFEYPPIGGGGSNANSYIFREFTACSDLHIDAITSAPGKCDEVVELSPNITLYRLAVGKRDLHYWTQREIMTWLLRAHQLAGQLLQESRYDLCHAFFGFPSGVLAWARRRQLPYLISLRGSDVPGFNPRCTVQYIILKPLFLRIWRQAQIVVANSIGLRQLAGRFEPDLDIAVVPNGIDTSEFTPALSGEQEDAHILCVSRLVERKGVQHLIEAMPQILQEIPCAHLSLVGEGDLLVKLQSRCDELGLAGKVAFLGHVPHDRLPPLYRKAQIYVSPAFYEGMSNTVLEAMASGLPIVATAEGGREELFDGNADMASFGSPESLAREIVRLLRQPATMATMGARSREIALKFSWSAVARRYREFYSLAGMDKLGTTGIVPVDGGEKA